MKAIHNEKMNFASFAHLDNGAESENMTSILIEKLAQTREFKEIVAALIPELIRVWVRNERLKQLISKPIEKSLKKSIQPDDQKRVAHKKNKNGNGAKNMASLFKDPVLTGYISDKFPDLINGLIDIAAQMATPATGMADDKKIAVKDKPKIQFDKLGEGLTRYVNILNKNHSPDSADMANRFETGFEAFIQNLDFGEIKELVDNYEDDMLAIVKKLNDVMFKYPPKVVLSVSLIPSFLNILCAGLKDLLCRFNTLPPDVLTDVVLSLIKEINGDFIGQLINEFSEIVRKMHTGSTMIGEPGNPVFSQVINMLLSRTVEHVDAQAFWKAMFFIGDGISTYKTGIQDILEDHPEHLAAWLKHSAESRNTAWMHNIRFLSLIDDLDDDDAGQAWQNLLENMNINDFAQIISSGCLLLNRAHMLQPDLINHKIAQFLQTLDIDEISQTVSWILQDFDHMLKPLARAVLPGVISRTCQWLSKKDDEYQSDIDHAFDALKQLLGSKEDAR